MGSYKKLWKCTVNLPSATISSTYHDLFIIKSSTTTLFYKVHNNILVLRSPWSYWYLYADRLTETVVAWGSSAVREGCGDVIQKLNGCENCQPPHTHTHRGAATSGKVLAKRPDYNNIVRTYGA